MFNFFDRVKELPDFYKQISVGKQLITEYNCPIETPKIGVWSHQNYFVYVTKGKKVWHTPDASYELTQGKCVFVKRGAHIIEQFFDSPFCVVVFFISDDFITETIRLSMGNDKLPNTPPPTSSVVSVVADDSLHAFFNSVIPYFLNHKGETNNALLELKFRELILNVISNPQNQTLKEYFNWLLQGNSLADLNRIMEENFYYNLHLEEFAKMSNRSLSAFKRDFSKSFNTTPGRWLLKRRLEHSMVLIKTSGQSISQIAYDCGFENISHFSRAFKRQFGTSPAKLREPNS